MKNIFKIALFLIVCSASTYAANDSDKSILNKKNDFHYFVENDTVKNPTTEPKKTDPRKKINLNDKNAEDIFIDTDYENYVANQLINVASDNLGVVYRAGGTSKNGFDCSGLIYSTFNKFNLTLPRSSHEMAGFGSKIEPQNAKKGDLIFFINRGQKRINHVGMVVDVCGDDIKFIHSSTQSGVVVSSIKEPYYQRTFAQINRVLE
ncbi:C40 family peptidase [Flavobacterium sp. RSB2_4_14]|uniref:C40 family peptidase n=1 Tax=Flavobacterium sp. RSB2_4_14 TaxID=3447665 RepID=UPI003F389912